MAVRSKKRRVVVADAPTAARYDELKWTLIERQREILSEVQGKIRDVRSERSEKDHAVLDLGETSEVAIQKDIEFALIQMKAETLNRIDDALSRFEDGTYGHCFECGEDIARPRPAWSVPRRPDLTSPHRRPRAHQSLPGASCA